MLETFLQTVESIGHHEHNQAQKSLIVFNGALFFTFALSTAPCVELRLF